ncbi:MAG: hypothetical protein JW782_00075 [Candidatus Saganbacteria bacterium]|nr:hypothetical protein [Candidatus Saganbacteria bacterium]
MKKILLALFCFFLCLPVSLAEEASYESLDLINGRHWAKYLDDLLGYAYDSHGCLHFTPSDVYLLYETLPDGIPLTIKKYKLGKNEPPFNLEKIPYLIDMTRTVDALNRHRATFKAYKTELLVYPSLDLLFIMVNDYPYAKVKTLAGLPDEFLLAYNVQPGKPIVWDLMLSTPTDPGEYSILRKTSHYISSTYYKNTVVPFGAWIKKVKGAWMYQKNGQWAKLPDYIVSDLTLPADQRDYNYYDINYDEKGKVSAARWAGHDFGKYVILWTKDGKYHYPEMGYAAGELVFEQIILLKDLVYLLTAPGNDDLDPLITQNGNFSFYKELYDFKVSKGARAPANHIDPVVYSYYKLFNGLELNDRDRQLMDERLVKAFEEYEQNRLPRNKEARWKALGLYNYLRINSLVIDKQAGWYEGIKADWDFLKELRIKLRQDFDQMGVLSLENRQNIVEQWLNDRMLFKSVGPPKQAKYLTDLSFSTFFKPDDAATVFTERERAIMLEKIRKAASGQGDQGLKLNIVDALNDYNFGILLNEILGDLYKSHGCMHISPRNMVLLYDFLPVGAAMKVYKYEERVSQEALASIPWLADMVNFREDLDRLAKNFSVTKEVQVAVYPYSGDWIIYVKDRPFARLRIRGGPQTKFYQLQGRSEDGKPLFEQVLAYPTTPGDYNIFRKVESYVSNIYHDTTIIPMGGIIKWVKEKNKYIFQDKEGNWKDMPAMVAEDLKQPLGDTEYTYYDITRDQSGEVVTMRWGSHPFGKYAIQTSKDGRSAWPELIHSSGDLIMEERQLVNDLIKVLTAPHDEIEKCAKYSQNFELYKICWDFINDPSRTDLIQARERAAYRLYFGLKLSSEEGSALPMDVIVANKVLRGQKLTNPDIKLLLDEGLAYKRSGELKINTQKIMGLQYDTYQYVVTIQKYAHHYGTLKKHWDKLSNIRKALLKDFNTFVIKDPELFHNFMRELMLERNQLERLSQENALKLLNDMLGE